MTVVKSFFHAGERSVCPHDFSGGRDKDVSPRRYIFTGKYKNVSLWA